MISKQDLLVIDFETFYSKDYSLSLQSYNTSEYVRDPQFLIHGVGIKDGKQKAIWTAGHDESLRAIEQAGYEGRPVVAHNTAFDAFIVHEHAGLHPRMYLDTLSMARGTLGHHVSHSLESVSQLLGFGNKIAGALDSIKGLRVLSAAQIQALGTYCVQDVELCHKVFWKLIQYIPWDELRLIHKTLSMFCEPKLLIAEDEVEEEWKNEQARKKAKLDETGKDISQFLSNEKFADMLRNLGVKPPMKTSPTTGKETYAFAKTDPGFKKLFIHPEPAVQLLAETRLAVKSNIKETRAKRILKAGENGQNLPVLLNYAGAHTYRWSGGNKINLQNLPRRGVLRRAIMAPEGHQLLVYDLSQIEARLNVWFCGQYDILRAFADFDRGVGHDVYRVMAAKIFGVTPGQVTADQRFIGKTCVLGLGYGMGWKRLQTQLAIGFLGAKPIDMPREEAHRIVNVYRAANPRIMAMWSALEVYAKNMSCVHTYNFDLKAVKFLYRMIELPSGLALKYPDLHISSDNQLVFQSRYGPRTLWGGLLLENIIQALARCVIGEQMLKIRWPIATMTHDEVVVIVPDEEIKVAEKEVYNIMATPPSWAPDLPLALEGGYDRRYIK